MFLFNPQYGCREAGNAVVLHARTTDTRYVHPQCALVPDPEADVHSTDARMGQLRGAAARRRCEGDGGTAKGAKIATKRTVEGWAQQSVAMFPDSASTPRAQQPTDAESKAAKESMISARPRVGHLRELYGTASKMRAEHRGCHASFHSLKPSQESVGSRVPVSGKLRAARSLRTSRSTQRLQELMRNGESARRQRKLGPTCTLSSGGQSKPVQA